MDTVWRSLLWTPITRYTGYFWPWNCIWMALTYGTYTYVQPDITRAKEFEPGWISLIAGRNLALMWLVYGGWHWYHYMMRYSSHKYEPKFPKPSDKFFMGHQIYDNLWYTHLGWLCWTGYEVVMLHMWATGRVSYRLDWSGAELQFCAWMFVIPFWREFHFYWIHRAIHWKPAYKYIHAIHHRNKYVMPRCLVVLSTGERDKEKQRQENRNYSSHVCDCRHNRLVTRDLGVACRCILSNTCCISQLSFFQRASSIYTHSTFCSIHRFVSLLTSSFVRERELLLGILCVFVARECAGSHSRVCFSFMYASHLCSTQH